MTFIPNSEKSNFGRRAAERLFSCASASSSCVRGTHARNAPVEFYRCPEELAVFPSQRDDDSEPVYFLSTEAAGNGLAAVSWQSDAHNKDFRSPFPLGGPHQQGFWSPLEASRIVDELRLERYAKSSRSGAGALLGSEGARWLYYKIRPALRLSLRQHVQRLFLRDWNQLTFPRWPVDTSVEEIFEGQLLLAMKRGKLESVPFIWFWPDGASSAAMMTHDVEDRAGLAFVPRLIDLDDEFGVKASYQIVPEQRYTVPRTLLDLIRVRQCEVNIHGLNHNGNLFRNRKTFLEQCKRINRYVQEFQAEGFRSACMYRNVDWYEELDISYDMSVPNVAHLEPQRGGCCTVFPYFIGEILELPLTTIQDYSLFHILGDYSIDLWKNQIERIMEKHGLISFITHPDYLLTPRAREVYKTLLGYLSDLQRDKKVWFSRPSDINRWWRQRSAMKLVFQDGKWNIQGEGWERACIAFAQNQGGRLVFTFEQPPETLAGSPRPAIPEEPLEAILNGACTSGLYRST